MNTINELKIAAKKQNDLTIEDIKAIPGKENLTDEQAAHIIASLKELSILLYYYATRKRHQIHNIDNQQIIRNLGYKQAA